MWLLGPRVGASSQPITVRSVVGTAKMSANHGGGARHAAARLHHPVDGYVGLYVMYRHL